MCFNDEQKLKVCRLDFAKEHKAAEQEVTERSLNNQTEEEETEITATPYCGRNTYNVFRRVELGISAVSSKEPEPSRFSKTVPT